MDLVKEEKRKLISEIQYFFQEERDEELGIIASEAIYDFILEKFSKSFYNKGLRDSKKWFEKRIEDLSFDFDLLYK